MSCARMVSVAAYMLARLESWFEEPVGLSSRDNPQQRSEFQYELNLAFSDMWDIAWAWLRPRHRGRLADDYAVHRDAPDPGRLQS